MATQKRFIAKNGLDNNAQTITNVATPVNTTDAVTKAYADLKPDLSSTTPAALGIAAVGTGTTAARADHIHTLPSLATLGAQAAGSYVTANGALGTPSSGTVTNLTGTASININGTVGATTANTGAFTTLGYSGTLTGGTGVIAIGTNQIYKDASGNVGIGTSSPSYKLDITGDARVNASVGQANIWLSQAGVVNGRINAAGGGGTDVSVYANRYVQFFPTDSLIISTGITPTECMRIDSSGNVTLQGNISVGGATPTTVGTGITFPATQVASSNANTLDDYEEGTWTPVLTSGFTTTGTVTRSGYYTKVGRVVTVNFLIQTTTVSPANAAVMSGLPFTATQYGIGLSTNAGGTVTAMPITVSGSTLIFGGVSISVGNLIGSVTYITT